MVILKDGVRYDLWTPSHEVNDFEPMIIHHVKDIFGPGCEYFPKQKLKTLANNRSIPDGFVVDFKNKKWYIVELKLLCDDAIRRITGQIVDYKNATKNQKTLRSIYKSIKSIKDADFLDDLINDEKPKIVVIIDSLDGELGKQFIEKVEGTESKAKIIEFKTYYREGAEPNKVHIHSLEPLDYSTPSLKMGAKSEREKVKKPKGLKQRHHDRIEFWSQLIEKAKKKSDLLTNRSGSKEYFMSIGTGMSGLHYVFYIAKNNAKIEFIIETKNKKRNKEIFDKLIIIKRKIEKDFGAKFEWKRMDDYISSHLSYSIISKGLSDKKDWPLIQDKMIDSLIRLEKTMKKYIMDFKK
jgi:hypothetical protein